MACLPSNVEKVRDGRGFRYVAYGAGAWRVHRDRSSGYWHAHSVTDSRYEMGATLGAVAQKVARHA